MPGSAGHFAFHFFWIVMLFFSDIWNKFPYSEKRAIRKLSSAMQKHRRFVLSDMLFPRRVRFRVQFSYASNNQRPIVKYQAHREVSLLLWYVSGLRLFFCVIDSFPIVFCISLCYNEEKSTVQLSGGMQRDWSMLGEGYYEKELRKGWIAAQRQEGTPCDRGRPLKNTFSTGWMPGISLLSRNTSARSIVEKSLMCREKTKCRLTAMIQIPYFVENLYLCIGSINSLVL